MTTLDEIQARVASTEKMFSGPHDVMPTHYMDRAKLLKALRAVEELCTTSEEHAEPYGDTPTIYVESVHAAIQQALDG